MCIFHLLQIMRQTKIKDMTQKKEKVNIQITANTMEENDNNKMEGEVVEEEVVVLPGKTKMPQMKALYSSPVRKELQKQMAECAMMCGVLH